MPGTANAALASGPSGRLASSMTSPVPSRVFASSWSSYGASAREGFGSD